MRANVCPSTLSFTDRSALPAASDVQPFSKSTVKCGLVDMDYPLQLRRPSLSPSSRPVIGGRSITGKPAATGLRVLSGGAYGAAANGSSDSQMDVRAGSGTEDKLSDSRRLLQSKSLVPNCIVNIGACC